MTGEFSRRSFLKYTALTAVVVAGSSLLTGCGGDAPVQRAVGTSNRVLKVISKLEQVEYDAASDTTTFKLVVTNGRQSGRTGGGRRADRRRVQKGKLRPQGRRH